MLFEPHSLKQQNVILSDKPITAAITGIQWGKTQSGALWMKRKMCEYIDAEDNFIIASPDYKIMYQSTLPPFLKFMDGLGRHDKKHETFKMHTGGTCYLRTGTLPDSVVGIPKVRAIWADEAGKFSKYFWDNLTDRAAPQQAQITITSTPFATNWLFIEIVRPVHKGLRDDVLLIQANSNENPYFSEASYRLHEKTMDPRRFASKYQGQFTKMHGLVYDCFNEDIHVIKPISLPFGTKFYAGIDWGHTEPFAMVVVGIVPTGERYIVSEFYKTGLTISDVKIIAQQKQNTYGITAFYAGPDRPENIMELNGHGLSCQPAENAIRMGIDVVYDLFKSNKLFVFKNSCPMLLDEISMYHYPEPDELKPDEKSKEQNPVGQYDHCIDALRYNLIMTQNVGPKRAPHVPGDDKKQMTRDERTAYLKKRSSNRKFEKWS